ncbi:hypothetical protein BKA62DRAFT_674322 [Auriculariales sp. MPI-PUGE-AT-0066]|nr:hypothetical protein BKA62DRAFT_674322 [Auriculariales sp. MPI-PUGE-AT-0066]
MPILTAVQSKHTPLHKTYPLPRTQLSKIFTSEQAQKPFLDRIRSKSYPPPSTAAKDSHLQRSSVSTTKPPSTTVVLRHSQVHRSGSTTPSSSDSCVSLRSARTVLTSKHLRLATELIDASTEFYGSEKERQDAIRHSPRNVHRELRGPSIDTFAGRKMINPFIEVETEIGAGSCDPLDQAAEDFAQKVGNAEVDPIRRRSCMPAFLVAIAGPNLAIGGALLLDRPVIELLTPDPASLSTNAPRRLNLLPRRRPDPAYCACDENARVDTGSCTVCVPWPHLTKIGNYEIEYQERLWRHRPVVSSAPGQHATAQPSASSSSLHNRYCREAHIVVSNHGAAPQLLHCDWDETVGQMSSCGSMLMQQSIRRLEDAVKAMHEAGFVHGDLREPNILLDGNNAPMIIDFDWAGPMDDPCTVYPSNICLDSSYNLHEDVCAGGRVLAEHDDHLVKNWIRQAQSTGL